MACAAKVSDSLAATRRPFHRHHPPQAQHPPRLAAARIRFTQFLLVLVLSGAVNADEDEVLAPNATMPTTAPTTEPPTEPPTTTTPTSASPNQNLLNGTSNNTAALLSGSDLSAIFYLHYSNGVIIPPLPFANSSVTLPPTIVNRLKTLDVEFNQLDGLLQRALLWDAGYIYNPPTPPSTNSRRRRLATSSASDANSQDADNSDKRQFPFLRVYTRNGVDMASIAPTRNDMESSGCALQLCSSEDYGTTWRAVACSDSSAILNTVYCAIDLVDEENQVVDAVSADGRPRTVWTALNMDDRNRIPNNSDIATPDVNVALSEWSDIESRQNLGSASANDGVRIFSIHTVPFSEEPPIGQCPLSRTDEQGSLLPTLTIPCVSYADVVGGGASVRRHLQATNVSQWRQPTSSKLVTTWLQSVAPSTSPTKAPTPGSRPTGSSAGPPRPDFTENQLPPRENARPVENNSNSSGIDLVKLVPIVIGALVAVAVILGFVVLRRRRNAKYSRTEASCNPYDRSSMLKTEDGYLDGAAYLSPAGHTVANTYLSGRSTMDHLSFDLEDQHQSLASTFPNSGSGRGQSLPSAPLPTADGVIRNHSMDPKRRRSSKGFVGMPSLRRGTSEPASTTSAVSRPSLDTEHLKLLQTDPNLSACRVSYDKIVFERVVSRSARYEVWLCQYEGDELAVKRLASTLSAEDVDTDTIMQVFVAEIRITAALDHPNIAKFVGVAWARLPADSLCLVMEYASHGRLRDLLRRGDQHPLSWATHKRKWAIGVASALEYLHAQQPVVLHLALHSAHVLLSDRMQPKLIDFGERLSPEDWTQLRTMAATTPTRVDGFPYWAAPEVLRGDGHSMASDVYSFGMLLAELDTCEAPLTNACNTSNGAPLKPFQLMNKVISGRLTPTLSATCPEIVNKVVAACTNAIPARRPSMREVLRSLQLADFEA